MTAVLDYWVWSCHNYGGLGAFSVRVITNRGGMELTKEFLLQKAHQWALTPEQEKVLELKFGQQHSNPEVAAQLGISLNACIQCLGEIYRKAGIAGRSRGKANRLRADLLQEAETQAAAPQVVPLHSQEVARPSAMTMPYPCVALPDTSTRQYLENVLTRIQDYSRNLSADQGSSDVYSAIQYLSDNLPQSTTALAIESRWKQVEVVQKMLQRFEEVVTEIEPSLDEFEDLDFLRTKNSIYRSITAFIERLSRQLNLHHQDSERAHDDVHNDIIDTVLKQGQEKFQDLAQRPPTNASLKTYSAWVRKACFDIVTKSVIGDDGNYNSARYADLLNRPQHPVLDMKVDIERNLRLVDASILEMYLSAKNPNVFNFNFFDILVARWMKNIPWSTDVKDSFQKGWLPSEDEDVMMFRLDTRDFEWAALNSLRRHYHHLSSRHESCETIHDYFLCVLKPVKKRYLSHFCKSYEDVDSLGGQASLGKYPIVSIPRSLCENDPNFWDETCTSIWKYCELASYNYLTPQNLKELDALLRQACLSPILDFWFNEIDHFVDHSLAQRNQLEALMTLV